MVILHQQNPCAGRGREYLARHGHAIRNRRDQRHIIRIRTNQRRRCLACAFMLSTGKARVHFPRARLAIYPLMPGFLHFAGQGAPGGSVEVADLPRDIEGIALTWQHGTASLFLNGK
ncbi:MAG: hypothetical protein EBU14_15195 [Acetobacteraceae bacterium]|nr:hypothetical protein [Acetobacteraceae bacterium]